MLTTFFNTIKLFFEKLAVWSETGEWKTKRWYDVYLKLQHFNSKVHKLRKELNTLRIEFKSKKIQYRFTDGRTIEGKKLKKELIELENKIALCNEDIEIHEDTIDLIESDLNTIDVIDGTKNYE